MVSSSDTLLVVSTLDIVQDRHLQPKIATCGGFLSLEGVNYIPVGTMGPFLLEVN